MSVSDPDHFRLSLELDPGSDRLSGRLLEEGTPDRAFSGWLEFVAAVESVHQRAAVRAPSDPAPAE